jgi:dolichol-phosphate mannosyltransferase
MDLTVVIPSYEESDNLGTIIPELKHRLSKLMFSHEILVIDSLEGCELTKCLCEFHAIKYVRRKADNSYGAAIKTGLHLSTGEYILVMDADGSHEINTISAMWDSRDPNLIVVASRYVEGGATENPGYLIALSWLVNFVFRIFLGVNCKDMSNSFRLYPGPVLRDMTLVSKNFDIIQEMIMLTTYKHNMKILELPTRFQKREYGRSKRNLLVFALSYGFTLVRLFALRLKIILTNKY